MLTGEMKNKRWLVAHIQDNGKMVWYFHVEFEHDMYIILSFIQYANFRS